DGLQLSVTVGRPVISVGDSTIATISLQNISAVPITVTTGGCLMLPYITAEATGEVVYPSGGHWFCVAVLRSLSLGPGAKTNQQLVVYGRIHYRSEEHTSELQSRGHLVCRLLLEKKKKNKKPNKRH